MDRIGSRSCRRRSSPRAWWIGAASLLAAAAWAQGLPPNSPSGPQLAFTANIQPAPEDFSAAQLRQAVRHSPLFLAELDHAKLLVDAQAVVRLQDGVELDLRAYLVGTRLAAQPALRAIAEQPRELGIVGPVTLREEAYLFEDRIIVSREMVVPVSASTCGWDAAAQRRERLRAAAASRSAPGADSVERARSALCPLPEHADGGRSATLQQLAPASSASPQRSRARRDGAVAGVPEPPSPAEIAEAAEAIRAELRQMDPASVFRHGITVAAALALPDTTLLRLDMDGEERIIHHVSVIPLQPRVDPAFAPAGRGGAPRLRPERLGAGFALEQSLGPAPRALPPALAEAVMHRPDLPPSPRLRAFFPDTPGGPAMQAPPPPPRRPGLPSADLRPSAAMPVHRDVIHAGHYYFVTGFTLSEQIEERRRRTFNSKRNWYVEVGYGFGYAAGLRFPFHIEAQLENRFAADTRGEQWRPTGSLLKIRARGSQHTVDGGSIYAAAGMPANLRLDDREFTLRVWAGCYFQGRFPIVRTVRIDCPSLSVPPQGSCPNWACADFSPPLGERLLLARPRLPADVTGLKLSIWFLTAGLEPGVNVYAADGRLFLDAEAREAVFVTSSGQGPACQAPGAQSLTAHNQLLEPGLCRLAFTRAPGPGAQTIMQVGLMPQGTAPPVLVLSRPVYSFDLEFVPVLTIFALIDIKLARWRFDHDIEVPGLAIRQQFRFERHAGTTERVQKGGCGPADLQQARCSAASGYRLGAVY